MASKSGSKIGGRYVEAECIGLQKSSASNKVEEKGGDRNKVQRNEVETENKDIEGRKNVLFLMFFKCFCSFGVLYFFFDFLVKE